MSSEMNVHSYTPSIPLKELRAAPGDWVLVDECESVCVSGSTLQEVVEIARQMKLDLSKHAIDRLPLEGEDQWLGITEG